MQTATSAIKALQKSRIQVGADKPSYSISISGLTAGADWDSVGTTWRTPTSLIDAGGISIEKKTNGKLIVCGMVGGTVYEGEVADVETLLGGDSTVTGWATTGITTNVYGRCFVFRENGDLWLTVAQGGSASLNASIELYKSASGNGGDWEPYSTIYSNTTADSDYLAAAVDMPGSFVVLPSGRWVFCGNKWRLDVGRNNRPAVWISDDSGVNWTEKYMAAGWYYGGNFAARPIRLSTGTLLWAFGTGSTMRVIKSTDNGSNWTEPYTLATNTPYYYMFTGGSLYLDGEDLLVFNEGNQGNKFPNIYRLTQPEVDGSFELVKILPLKTSAAPTYIVNVVGNAIFVGNKSVLGMDLTTAGIPIKSISISRQKNMAASLELVIDNADGDWAPDGTVHAGILWPNKVVTIQQGYGTEMFTTFTGLIDRIEMSSFPAEIRLSCRDYMKYALDQLVTKAVTGGNTHVLQYQAQTVEAIVTELAGLCGLTLLETIYTTGITIADITFSWCSYGDAFSQLADLVGADYGCDEFGEFYFRKDYIADTPTIAHIFKEGEDIVSLGYVIDDADIYQKCVAYGIKSDGTSCFAQTLYTSRNYYNVLTDKYMKIDAGAAAPTATDCQALTDRAEILMRSRVRICTFAAIAVPWLQVGDVIQVIETSTTISEAYRITDLSTTMDESGFTMLITCYHHSYAE